MMKAVIDWLVPRTHAASYNYNFLNPSNYTASTSVGTLANRIITYVLLIAGVLAVGYLIYSGILYITAAGNPDSAKKGQQGVINAIIGIIIIMLAFFIVRFAMGIGSSIGTGSIS